MSGLVALLGGSFDPVHNGHLALAALFNKLLAPGQLRVIPAGNPWQKTGLHASAEQRIAMLELAFRDAGIACTIDRQEVDRGAPTYSIDTLRAIRAEVGPDVPLVFLMGADQLQHLDSWRQWPELFKYAHFAVAARPGYALDALPQAVADAVAQRLGNVDELKTSPSGRTLLAPKLAVDISATEVRAALQRGAEARSLVPGVVLDYIQQQNLYNKN